MMTQPVPFDHAAERARQRFQGHMAREALQARIEARPMLPLFPLQTVTHQGEVFSVERTETGGFDTLSPTARYSVILIRHSDGKTVEFAPVIRKQRRRKSDGHATVRYHAPTCNYSGWDELVTALAEAAVERLSTYSYHDAQPFGGPRAAGDQMAVFVAGGHL